MRIILLSSFILIATQLNSQNKTYQIPLPIDYASQFEFIMNDWGYGCLFLNHLDTYCIILVDSNYNVVKEFKDNYYTTLTPDFVGSIAEKEGFELFFRRMEDNVLLVLKIDIQTKTLKRVKDFKITETSDEKILYTGSTLDGNKMLTLSYNNTDFIYKLHRFGLLTKDIFIPLKEEDRKILKDGEIDQLKSDSIQGNLILMIKTQKVTEKNPVFHIFHIEPDKKEYYAFEVGCGEEKRYQTFARFSEDILLLNRCNGIVMLNNLTGEFIKELSINFDSIYSNENIPMFAFSYNTDFNSLFDPRRYDYLKGEERRGYFSGYLEIERDSTSTFLVINGYKTRQNDYPIRSRIVLPFDWNNKKVIYAPAIDQNTYDKRVMYEIDKRIQFKVSTSDYFIGFDGLCLGYLPKRSDEFFIELIDPY